jgi:YVTN family beta-propeller protein
MRCRFLLALVLASASALLATAQDKPRFAGPTEKGFLLPNGWTITPVGKQIITTDLPLNILPLNDNKQVLIATSGFNRHELLVIDIEAGTVVSKETVRQSWFGLTTDMKQETVWWSGGGANMMHRYALAGGKLSRTGKPEPDTRRLTKEEKAKLKGFKSGLALSADGTILYSLNINEATLTAFHLNGDDMKGETVTLGGRPYDIVVGKGTALMYVSDWAGRQVLGIDPETLRVIARIPVGEHPNQLALHPTDGRLFVSCASSNCVSVIDTKRGVVTETIMTGLFPKAPEGSTPIALAVAPDGKTIYVANADNNCVAVIDIEKPNESQVRGFIPTGWYPTAVSVTPDGKHLLVGVGKGNQTRPNPIRKKGEKEDPLPDELKEEPKKGEPPGDRRLPFPYIGTTLSGALSVVPVPDEKTLKEYTAQVYRNCPYSDQLLSAAPHPEKTAIPSKVGDPSPIKHVIYIIMENRTYDQVFGDLKEGNGDSALVMFGEKVTPNRHKLAREFVLLDNLYCNGQVSRDGHPWSTMAYNTDYIARDWHLTYSGRKGVDDDDDGGLSNAPSGYIWDACARAKLSYRSYGEYGKRVSQPDGTSKMEGRVPGLIGHMSPDYGVPKKKGAKVRDTDRVETFLHEFHEFENNNNLPRLIVMSLPEDHTYGTKVGENTPQACVASNDLGLGRLVEAVSQSKYWKETAIFVIEDDAQNGPDHVDAHRTAGHVISPYTKRHFVDSTQYSTVSMIRTIELVLGLPPLSQYDAAARPMFNSFTDKPDLTAYQHVEAQTDLESVNTKLAYGAERSNQMDFSDVDRIDDFELNEILWRAIKGTNAPIPPAVRRAIAFRSLTAEHTKKE